MSKSTTTQKPVIDLSDYPRMRLAKTDRVVRTRRLGRANEWIYIVRVLRRDGAVKAAGVFYTRGCADTCIEILTGK